MTTWPDFAALELLVAVADHGSLGAGARAVGVAQPNASRSLSRLERRLGITLLVRSTHGSDLTPQGVVVVEWARNVLDAGHALLRGVAGLAQNTGSVLPVAASQTIAEHLLPQWISRLRRTIDITVDIHVENSADVLAEVLDGHVAVGFVEGHGAPRGVRSTVVAHDELVLVIAPDHPWSRRRGKLPLEALAATPLVTREQGSGTRNVLDRALGPLGPATASLELGSNAAVRVAVRAGTAPAVLSRLAVADDLAHGELIEVPVVGLDTRRNLRAIWIGPRTLTGAAGRLVSCALSPTPV